MLLFPAFPVVGYFVDMCSVHLIDRGPRATTVYSDLTPTPIFRVQRRGAAVCWGAKVEGAAVYCAASSSCAQACGISCGAIHMLGQQHKSKVGNMFWDILPLSSDARVRLKKLGFLGCPLGQSLTKGCPVCKSLTKFCQSNAAHGEV